MVIPKQYVYVTIAVLVTFGTGIFIGVNYLAPALTQHHYHENTIVVQEKPITVQGEVKTITDTQIAYVPKEIVITKYLDKDSGKEISKDGLEKTDVEANIGKQEINVKLNDKDISFQKTEDEKYALEKNKITLQQTTKIEFNAKVEPAVIDNTRHWGIGTGYGSNGWAGELVFPINKKNNIDGWLYKDKDTQTGGIMLRF